MQIHHISSSNGITNSGGKMVSVNKGDWDTSLTLEDKHVFNRQWIKLCKRFYLTMEPFGFQVLFIIYILLALP